MATRSVTGVIHKPDGTPWDAFDIHFTVTPTAFTASAHYPVETITVTTDATGAFSVDLETGIQYEVLLYSAVIPLGSSGRRYPPGVQFTIVVPEGVGAVSLEDLRADEATPLTPTLLGRLDVIEQVTQRILTREIDVRAEGAVGDGVTDYTIETAAFASAITKAAGKPVVVPAGVYTLANIPVADTAHIRLEPGAVLRLRPGAHVDPLFDVTGTKLVIRGAGHLSVIDGNRANVTGRPALITGDCEQGKVIDIQDVHVTAFVFAWRISQFGGYLNFSHNHVTDQAQHSGVDDEFSAVGVIVNGQEGAKGTIVTDRNYHYFDDVLDHDGSNPGGYFVATSPDIGGGATPFGNFSTWQADGNYFYGYGQFGGPGAGTNDISPLHTYPTIAGARWTNNYFEQCGFCAMSAKSVVDFVCTGNVITNGMTSPRNHALEGAISYVPGYQAGSESRPRGVIANNIVDMPGGEPALGQTAIAVKGTSTSKVTDVVVANNVLLTDGVGIDVVNAIDVTLAANIIRIVTGVSPADAGICVRLSNVEGRVNITGGSMESENGNLIVGISGNATAKITIQGTDLIDQRSNGANLLFRDCALLKLSGLTIDRPTGIGQAMNIGGTIGHFAYDDTNTIEAGDVSIDWTGIGAASGQLIDTGSPVGVVTPDHAGVLYRQIDATGASVLFVATGTTSADWLPLVANAVPSVSTASVVYGTNSVGGALNRRAASGERVAGQIPVYGSAGDLVVANVPGTVVSATSKDYVDDLIAALDARVTALEGGA